MRRQKKVLRRARYPLRPSKYSNHVYDDHQHLIMLVLRQYVHMPYRDFCDLMAVCTLLLEELELDEVPHFTTLQKFSARTDTRRLELLLLSFLIEARLRVLHLGVDSTGYSCTSASQYYIRTLEVRKNGPGPPKRGRLVRRYLKQTLAVETRKQLIAAVKFRMGPANDSPDFIPVVKKAGKARQDIMLVTGDKGYDAERNHEYVHEVIGGRSVIPVRRGDDPRVRIRGWYRRRQWKHFDSATYRQRVKVETVNSVQKRTMGSSVLSRKTGQRHKEMVFRALAYNGRRMETFFLVLIEGFYKALGWGKLAWFPESYIHIRAFATC